MAESELPQAEPAHEPEASKTSLPVDSIERVTVKLRSKRVEVHAVPPFLSLDNAIESGDSNLLSQAQLAIENYGLIEAVCSEVFPEGTANVQILPPKWPYPVTDAHVKAVLEGIIDWYAKEEAIASKWLQQADRTVVRDDSRINVEFMLSNQSEVNALEKKRTGMRLSRKCEEAFGLHLSCKFSVAAASEELSEALRQQLAEQERKEVEQLMQEQESISSKKSAAAEQAPQKEYEGRRRRQDSGPAVPLTLGRGVNSEIQPIHEIVDEMRRVAVEGRVFGHEVRTLPSGRVLVQFNITDETDSIAAKTFIKNDKQIAALEPLKDGVHIRIQGSVQFDTYAKELVFMIQDMEPARAAARVDEADEKRIELHMHTTMSSLDGVASVDTLIEQAAKWGHKAVAVTDHGVVQSFPEAYDAGAKHGVKVLLGVEAYVVDDGTPIVYRSTDQTLAAAEYVVFDTETTGLNAREDTLIEIAAVRVKEGRIIDSYTTLIDPERMLPKKITEVTGISSDMLHGQPKLETALNEFREFTGDAVLVAHNAEFDIGFLAQCAKRIDMAPWEQPVIDTLSLARALYPGMKNYKLKTLTNKFSIELENHHRALADAEATGKLFMKMLMDAQEQDITNLSELNGLSADMDVSRVRPFHATILVQNQTGLKNLYELISLSHTKYLFRNPRIPRSELVRFREGLLVGTACRQGELIESFIRGKSEEEIEEICRFYDYLELQPLDHYESLVRDNIVQSMQSIRDIQRQVVEIGKKLEKPVVASGDVHYVNPEDSIYREVFLQSLSSSTGVQQPSLYFRTTAEMMSEFEHLGEDAKAVVVDNPSRVCGLIDDVKPIPDDLFTPVIEGAEEEMTRLSYEKAKEWYGDPLPELVEARLKKELDSIISNGFAVIYLIAHKLVVKSLSDGYLVGSRGSVGSSLVATMSDITEVNPLPPHYRCPNCKHSEFFEAGEYGSGYDLPEKECDVCKVPMIKDGQDIPFETFLGFKGDKVPDIDLNFSGEYQPRAHKFTEEMFGKDHVFRAGTISTVAEKTAYGYVRKFAEERGLILRNAEIDRLVKGCTGIKRTTGQHPGGQMVVPSHLSIHDFCPVQYPADDKNSDTYTTHFDYHSISGRLLKLDILGHDDPTVIRMLQDLTGIEPKTIPLDDPRVMGLFSGTDTLGVKPEELRSATGTYAIPEFGTKFVRQMLEDTRPTTFAELVRISGLSHGTDVWLNNAQELIRSDTATLSEVICARDDIMIYLIHKGLDPSKAFKIMESIRKGRGVKQEEEDYMKEHGVPDWYIESGRKIKYMFPKAHAAAYVLMAVRIAWFKIYHPLAFYATYFSVRADDFDVELMAKGREAILEKIREIEEKGNTASPKEKSLMTVLEVALEMVTRGYRFLPVDLYESDAVKFRVMEDQNALLPPFGAISGVGVNAAKSLYEACKEGPLLSVEDLQSRSRASKTVIEILTSLGCLEGLPATNQLSLF
ncbi:PolC-type DNA polymerase III [Alicyclobacillus sp. SO9]|uniref:PolC-type DNA polymerase III n=1 Tax=Alicyclobacillus sp. SO9 TaxID=2665646 RepID=UPI0018E8BFB7|nr:PolC-type DNA polymerase III [Alicyclobacillus sp. SO9]QQE80834.1 PolC-type DNA polymerase III [Alicyclobacillus sp. SO9]